MKGRARREEQGEKSKERREKIRKRGAVPLYLISTREDPGKTSWFIRLPWTVHVAKFSNTKAL
jgi:hypothetical protein